MKQLAILSLVIGLFVTATAAFAESTTREGYVKLPALSQQAGGVYLMLDQGHIKTVGQAEATEAKEASQTPSKVRCTIQPKFNGCL